MQIRIKIDPGRITLDDLIAVEDSGKMRAKEIKPLVAKFLTDEAGNYLPEPKAIALVGKMSLTQIKEAIEQFGAGIKKLQESAVPPASGGN